MKNTILLIILLSFGEMIFAQNFQDCLNKKYLDRFNTQSRSLYEKSNNFDNIISERKIELCPRFNNNERDLGQFRHGFSFSMNGCYLLAEQFNTYNFSYTLDLMYSLRIRKNFLFQTGVLFDDLKSYQQLTLSFNGTLINRSVYDYYRFIGFPLKINFLYELEKIQFMAGFGSAFSILVFNHSRVEDDVNGTIENSRFNNGSKIILFTSNCRINYRLTKKISIGLNTEFRHSLTPLKEWSTTTSGEPIYYNRSVKYCVFGVCLNYFIN